MGVGLKDAVMIGRREARGYVIFDVSGRLDRDIYPAERGEEGPLDRLNQRLSEINGAPYAIDVRNCRFRGSDSIALFIEAYKIRHEPIPVISTDEHLRKILGDTKIGFIVKLYDTEESLPPISSS